MIETGSQYSDISQIIAADHRCGEINPQDDQIWELNTSRGEPPGVALQTTYGLRAYGMRIFPRFLQNKIPISNPHAFTLRPILEYSAPNFVSLAYSPVTSIDVIQKVWVPDSHTLVGQITITNTTDSTLQLGMEWVVLLNPLFSGSSMTSTQISINTVLQGQTQHLFPVFFLTGGPQSNLSAFPSLAIDLNLAPHANRQFSWALATLGSTDESFYHARKSTAISLDNEQIKIQMLQKQQTINFNFSDPDLNDLMQQSQQKTFQLILPPFRDFIRRSYVPNRLPDQGFNLSDKAKEFSSGWGVQRIHEVYEISRLLLPSRPDVVKELIQNLLDQQGDDGTIFAQTSWSGNITGLPAAPLLVSLVLDLYNYLNDLEWLTQIYSSLLRSVWIWFESEHDFDNDGYPEWNHLLQTGVAESTPVEHKQKINLGILIQVAEWPSLASLLVQECQGLIKIAGLIGDTSEVSWLEEHCQQLRSLLQESWDEKQAFYNFRDKESHLIHDGKVLHSFRQNGSSELSNHFSDPVRLCIKVHSGSGTTRSIECLIKGVVNHHEKVLFVSAKDLFWEDDNAFNITKVVFSTVKQITVTGLKKGDLLTVEIPDLKYRAPDFLIPLWAGIPSTEQAQKLIQRGAEYLDTSSLELPHFLKIMWLEGLCKYNYKELASRYFQQWFLKSSPETDESSMFHGLQHKNLAGASLNDLPPLQTFLQLLSIQKISRNELILKGFNDFFPKVIVQYKKFQFVLEKAQTRIQDLNGESVIITEPGSHRIGLS